MMPPTAKQPNEESAAVQGEGCSSGSTPSSCTMCTLTASSGSCVHLAGHRLGGGPGQAHLLVHVGQLGLLGAAGCRRISSRSTATSCATASFWVPTEANSPRAIENAPATSPAIPVRMIISPVRAAAADAGDQRDVGDQPVHRPEHRRPQPAAGDVPVMVVAWWAAASAGPGWLMARG